MDLDKAFVNTRIAFWARVSVATMVQLYQIWYIRQFLVRWYTLAKSGTFCDYMLTSSFPLLFMFCYKTSILHFILPIILSKLCFLCNCDCDHIYRSSWVWLHVYPVIHEQSKRALWKDRPPKRSKNCVPVVGPLAMHFEYTDTLPNQPLERSFWLFFGGRSGHQIIRRSVSPILACIQGSRKTQAVTKRQEQH